MVCEKYTLSNRECDTNTYTQLLNSDRRRIYTDMHSIYTHIQMLYIQTPLFGLGGVGYK